MSDQKKGPKYQMTITLNVLNHLGFNLYSNIPSVLSEVVANSYDADAEKVEINFNGDTITIKDDGSGMSGQEINDKYLKVGYEKRENGEAITPIHGRPVMGRKGIGKLSLFAIANCIHLHSVKNGETSSLEMTRKEITKQIKENNGKFYPKEISNISIEKGTTIVISDLKKTGYQIKSLRKRLAKRFSVIGKENNFQVLVDDDPISIEDREYLNKVQFIWNIGGEELLDLKQYDNIKNKEEASGEISFTEQYKNIENELIELKRKEKITGWIGTVKRPSQLEEDKVNNNKISIICRGKVAQEDILEYYTEGGIYADYLVGEIQADFLDDDDRDDIATSSRQSINENDTRFVAVKEYIYSILKVIQSEWTELRNTKATEEILNEFPVVRSWYNKLPSDEYRGQASKIFKTIDKLHFNKDGSEEKKTLVRQAVLAFEQLKIRDSLEQIDKITNANELELVALFGRINEIEALLYYDIAKGRVDVLRQLHNRIEENALEKTLQELIFDNIWLLNPSWERATRASERMEVLIKKGFKGIIDGLTNEEKNARLDVEYRSSGGKHVIVELKRYKTTYKVTPFTLAAQIDKYHRTLKKILQNTGIANPHIEVICIVGDAFDSDHDRSVFDQQLSPYNGRVYPYDQLLEESLQSYSDYLQNEEEVSRIKSILNDI